MSIGFAFPLSAGEEGFPKIVRGSAAKVAIIKALLTTVRGERVMRPGVGVNLLAFVFEKNNPFIRARLVQECRNALREVSVDVVSIDIRAVQDQNAIVVKIVYKDDETGLPVDLEITV